MESATGRLHPIVACLVFALFVSSTARAQLDLFAPPPTLPSLPAPPALQHALFENPIPPVIMAIALGLAAYAIASRLDRRKIGLVAVGGAVVLGGALVALSGAIQTNRERVQTRTRAIVGAIADVDIGAMDRILDPDARLFAIGRGSGWSKDAIMDWVTTNLGSRSIYEVEDHRVGEIQAEIGPSGRIARTRVHVTITPAQGSPFGLICMMTWQLVDAETWVLIEIEPLWLQGWGEISYKNMRDTPRW